MNGNNKKAPEIKIEGYEEITYLCSGGNSYVYKAKKNNKYFAIKLSKWGIKTGSIHYRLKNEIDFGIASNHKNIVKIVQNGSIQVNENYHVFYIMPFYAKTLRDLMNEETDYQTLINLFQEACKGIKYAHNKGIIHRDIKPENILYDDTNKTLVIADFGIAHFPKDNRTNKNEKLANFKYASPEQRNSRKVTKATDIYSLGLILNEIFTKEIPDGENYKKINTVSPLHAKLDNLVNKMTQSNIKNRIQNINIVINELRDFNDKNSFDILYIANELNKYNEYNIFGKLKKQLISDVAFASMQIKTGKFDQNFNYCFHNNITYSINDNLLNSMFIYFESVQLEKKVKNETFKISASEEWFKYNKLEKEKYEELKNKILKLETLIECERYSGYLLRMINVLKCNNALTFIENFDKKYLEFYSDNKFMSLMPLIEFMIKAKEVGLVMIDDILNFVEIDLSKTELEIDNFELYEEDKITQLNNKLANQFLFTFIDESRYEDIKVTFETKQAKDAVVNLTISAKNTYLKDNYDIDDVVECLTIDDGLTCYFEHYNFYKVLCEYILKIENTI